MDEKPNIIDPRPTPEPPFPKALSGNSTAPSFKFQLLPHDFHVQFAPLLPAFFFFLKHSLIKVFLKIKYIKKYFKINII